MMILLQPGQTGKFYIIFYHVRVNASTPRMLIHTQKSVEIIRKTKK